MPINLVSPLRNISSRFRKLGPISVGGVGLRERRLDSADSIHEPSAPEWP
jgi:hypothetical protein